MEPAGCRARGGAHPWGDRDPLVSFSKATHSLKSWGGRRGLGRQVREAAHAAQGARPAVLPGRVTAPVVRALVTPPSDLPELVPPAARFPVPFPRAPVVPHPVPSGPVRSPTCGLGLGSSHHFTEPGWRPRAAPPPPSGPGPAGSPPPRSAAPAGSRSRRPELLPSQALLGDKGPRMRPQRREAGNPGRASAE